MDENTKTLRLDCLRLAQGAEELTGSSIGAQQAKAETDKVIARAQAYADFIEGKATSK